MRCNMRIRCVKTVELEEVHDNGDIITKIYECNRNYQPIKVTTTDGEFVDIHFDWGYIKDVNKEIFHYGGPIEQVVDNKELKEEVMVEEIEITEEE